MKEHSEEFKNQIKELGRQFRSQVIYGVKTLEEELYAVTPHYEGNILKSTMKQLDIETTENIPIMTQVNYKLGMLVDGNYEWLDFGNYIVYSSEKQEDKDTYKLVCYDKLLYSMIPYLGVDGAFPMTVREYLNEICTKLGLTFGSNTEEFTNYDREIPSDRYLELEDYTYRDVFDEIAQVTGGIICLNSDDEVVVKYINEGIDNYNTVEGTSFTLTDASGGMASSITELKGNTTQEGTPTPTSPVEVETVSGDNSIVVSNKNLFDIYTAIDRPSWNKKICDRIITDANNFTLKSNATDDWCGIYLDNLDSAKNYTIKFTATLLEGVEGNSLYVGTADTNSPRTAIYTNTPKEVEYSFTNSSKIYIKIVSQTRVQFSNVQLEERNTSNRIYSTSR